jgi:hypothetical protein
VKQKWVLMTEEAPSGEETVAAVAAEMVTAEVSEAATAAPGKCTRLSVLTAVLRLKSPSSQLKADRFTAGIAFQTTESSKFKFLNTRCCPVSSYSNTATLFNLCFLPYTQVKGIGILNSREFVY